MTVLRPPQFAIGERVRWSENGRTYYGRIVGKTTAPLVIRGHRLDASPVRPRWLVLTDAGGRAAHAAEILTRVRERPRGPEQPKLL